MDLEDRLEEEIARSPRPAAVVERVKKVIRYHAENPEKKKSYRFLEQIDDFILYYEIHPMLNGRRVKELKETPEGSSFYDGLNYWFGKKAFGKKKKERMRQKLFSSTTFFWINYTKLEDWMEHYKRNPKWHGKSTRDMQKESESNQFYHAFYRWTMKIQPNDPEERKRLRQKIFKPKYNEWNSFTSIEDWKKYYDSHPEFQGMNVPEFQADHAGGGSAFYAALTKWVRNKTKNKRKRTALVREVLVHLQNCWTHLKTLDDWVGEFQKNPEWEGMSPRDMEEYDDKSRKFYIAFSIWAKDNAKDKRGRKRLTNALFNLKLSDWFQYSTIDDWMKEFERHPKWHGLNLDELQIHDSGGRNFYRGFMKWVDEQAKSEKQQRELKNLIFPYRKPEYRYRFRGDVVSFDSKQERTIGILLNKYGLIKCFDKGANLHVHTNGNRQHSIDFLIGRTFIEYHPLHTKEIQKGVTLEQSGKRRLDNITNEAYLPCEFWHIWEVEQLYTILKDPVIQEQMYKRYRKLTEEQFLNHLKEARDASAAYDRCFPGPRRIKKEDRFDYSPPKVKSIRGKKKQRNLELLEKFSMAA